MNDKAAVESGKTTSRMATITALAVVVTYFVNSFIPNMPEVVVAAILTLVGVAFDAYQYHSGGRFKLPY